MKKVVIALLISFTAFTGFHAYRYLNPVNKPYQDTVVSFITFSNSFDTAFVEMTPAPSELGFSFCVTLDGAKAFVCYREDGVRTIISEDGKTRHQKTYQGFRFRY